MSSMLRMNTYANKDCFALRYSSKYRRNSEEGAMKKEEMKITINLKSRAEVASSVGFPHQKADFCDPMAQALQEAMCLEVLGWYVLVLRAQNDPIWCPL